MASARLREVHERVLAPRRKTVQQFVRRYEAVAIELIYNPEHAMNLDREPFSRSPERGITCQQNRGCSRRREREAVFC